MVGFMRIIDALGGVTVNLSTNVHLVPNIDGQTKEAPSVGPGPVNMNGAMALSFVRSREKDSDYSRMKRQRCLLAAVAGGTKPTDLAVNYLGLASAVEGAFRSDIPASAWVTWYESSASSTCRAHEPSCSCPR